MKAITIKNPKPAIEISKDQAKELGIDITKDQNPGKLETFGPWNIPTGYTALCISARYEAKPYTKTIEKTLYGIRKLSNIKLGGYELEGRVSIRGKKYTAFTTSQLFEVDGKLIDVACIHARVN